MDKYTAAQNAISDLAREGAPDEESWHVTQWVVVAYAESVDPQHAGEHMYTYLNPPNQPPHQTQGLLSYGAARAARNITTDDDGEAG